MERARERTRQAYESGDHPIIQAISAYNELERMKGVLYERMEEWYGIYFPELKTGSAESYSRLINGISDAADGNEALLKELLGEKSARASAALREVGRRRPSKSESSALSSIAELELKLSSIQKALDEYLKESAKQRMPNITYLIEYKLAAELLGKAGSLERLAMLPASTIQLLGAEKALFKHLKYGGRPPKHGILYRLPEISAAERRERGRIARIYATKISIASRADAFSKRFIADKLKESLVRALGARRQGSQLHKAIGKA